MIVQITAGLLAAGAAALVVGPGCCRWCGATAPTATAGRCWRPRPAWRWGRRRRQHLYSSALTGPVSFGTARLPGLLANSTLLSAVTAHGEQFALIHLPSTKHYAVMIRCDPEGSQLVDTETVDEWVACWGGWLARLGHEANLEACTVTDRDRPRPGVAAGAPRSRRCSPRTRRRCRGRCCTEAAASYPHGAAAVHAYVTLTFSARRVSRTEAEGMRARPTGQPAAKGRSAEARRRRAGVRSPQEMAAQIGRRLPLLLHQLRSAGAGTGTAMTAAEVAETVRVAYDPAAAVLLDRASAQQAASAPRPPGTAPEPLVGWADAGPVAQVEAWDHLRHDSGASITWQMVDVPHGAVQSRVLEQLLDADPHLARKRVTLIYRPHDPASAARVADADVRTAIGRATLRQGEGRATESLALASARQSAAEQAAGAGLVRFSMLVTATVDEVGKLAQAAEVIDQLGPACQLRLRRCYFSQAAAFTAALGVGVVLPKHVAVPDVVRDHL